MLTEDQRLNKWLSNVEQKGACLLWKGCVDKDGYPRARTKESQNLRVHRWIFEKLNGYSPQTVRHSCDNPRCLNPEHLLAGNPTTNAEDRTKRGRTHRHVSNKEAQLVKTMRESGKLYKEIANELNINVKRVEYILRRRLVICVES
jgi:hypothetical protein